MATITPVAPSSTGSTIAFAAASGGGDSVANAKGATLQVRTGSTAINVTLVGAVNCNQGHLHDEVIAVAANVEKEIVIPAHCVNPDTGACAVTYSAVTSVTVAATSG